MVKERFITRRINFTECKCLLVNVLTKECTEEIKIVTGDRSEKECMEIITRDLETMYPDVKLVSIIKRTVTEQQYKMTEDEFCKYAKLV